MSISVETVTAGVLTCLRASGAWKVGDSELPENIAATDPYGVLYFIPGGPTTGGLNGNLEMATFMYQLKIVGYTAEQARRFHDKMISRLETAWQGISGLMGPPRAVTGGILPSDRQTFVADVTIYMEVTGV
jgi:hypothetical protein